MSVINFNDSLTDICIAMSGGNPGAAVAISEILAKAPEIDRDSSLGGIGHLLYLDKLEIYGTDIYILYSDQCKKDIMKLLILLRATQFGEFSSDRLKELAADQTGSNLISDDEFAELESYVCEKLPGFKRDKPH